MKLCLQAGEDALAGFLENLLRSEIRKCSHTGQGGELIGTIVAVCPVPVVDGTDMLGVVDILPGRALFLFFWGSLPLRAQEQPSTIQQTLKTKHKCFLVDDVYFRLEKQKNINYII